MRSIFFQTWFCTTTKYTFPSSQVGLERFRTPAIEPQKATVVAVAVAQTPRSEKEVSAMLCESAVAVLLMSMTAAAASRTELG
jgi:hypothetical protein